MPIITPSVGRKVWYYETPEQSEPIDATIIDVVGGSQFAIPESRVTLSIIRPNGCTGTVYGMRAHYAGEKFQGPHYQWMPYQLGLATKTETPASA